MALPADARLGGGRVALAVLSMKSPMAISLVWASVRCAVREMECKRML